MTRIRLLLAPLAVVTPLAAGCGQDAPSVPQGAIAVVGDRTIDRSQYDTLMAQAKQSYAASGRTFPAPGTAGYKGLRELAVRLLVEQAELDQEAPKLGVSVADGQVESRLHELKEQSFGGSEERYRRRLRAAGMTDLQVRAAIRAQLTSAAVRRAVTADVAVPPEAVTRYYEAHLGAYTTPPTRAVRHILVRDARTAERIYDRVRTGTAFAALARRFSLDPRTKGRGGALRLVEGRTAAELDRIAFSLPTGAVSRPFRTTFGWELVQASAPARPRRVTPLAAARAPIRTRLLAQRRAQVFQGWMSEVRRRFESKTAFAPGFEPGSPR
jgi:parvulin-like peptidyl-prolyl isomerase